MTDLAAPHNPRAVLASWANTQDEWVRWLVGQVLSSGAACSVDDIARAYALFRQEKGFDERVIETVNKIEVADAVDEKAEPLRITKLGNVTGINAIATGAVIEPHEGLTILFGENGTGKTGYSRVLKALAGSRTAVPILGDIRESQEVPQSAEIIYALGQDEKTLIWDGTHACAPFTRLSVFDSPAVNFHVDEDLEYVYVPAALALFNHVTNGLASVQKLIDSAAASLAGSQSALLSRFKRESSIYAHVESLGAATDLASIKQMADFEPKGDDRIGLLQRGVSALESDSARATLQVKTRLNAVLTSTATLLQAASANDAKDISAVNDRVREVEVDYARFRQELFEAANLPAEPDATWHSFVASGQKYRDHLKELRVHDETSCLYCRQPMAQSARTLLNKYAEYLEDKIAVDLQGARKAQQDLVLAAEKLDEGDLTAYISENVGIDDPSDLMILLRKIPDYVGNYKSAMSSGNEVDQAWIDQARIDKLVIEQAQVAIAEDIQQLKEQVANRAEALEVERKKLIELRDAVELGKVWAQVETQTANAKEAYKLSALGRKFQGLKAAVTEMSKTSSDQMVNQSFDALFAEECEALRAPLLKVQYVGRQGKSQRRKIMAGRFKPSKILSEGDQKVLALADFLAEARLSGITATVVFDDPVSSLDHRRVDEVATRVAGLAASTQVIVFTHDILFATKLLSLFEQSKRCVYYQVTDDGDSKGQVTRASGPRWDTIKYLTGRVNATVQDAKASSGEVRDALIRTGYSWIRSWCEVFVESEVLGEVTMRYQPNVKMGALPKLKFGELPAVSATVSEVFDRACRYIDGHSQPLASLNVTPSIADLEKDWKTLTDCRAAFNKA